MPKATMTSKGQVTIPKEVRESLGVGAGDELDFVLQADGTVRIRRLGGSVRRVFGVLRRSGLDAPDDREMDREIAAEVARRRAGRQR